MPPLEIAIPAGLVVLWAVGEALKVLTPGGRARQEHALNLRLARSYASMGDSEMAFLYAGKASMTDEEWAAALMEVGERRRAERRRAEA